MMRVVLDTNIFISGFRSKPGSDSKPKAALEKAIARRYTLVLSEDILEIEDVLMRKFAWSASFVASTLEGFRLLADMVTPEFELTDCADPDDNHILEAAVEGCAGCIVTGDKKHLLRLQTFRGIEIITASDFLLRLESESTHQGS